MLFRNTKARLIVIGAICSFLLAVFVLVWLEQSGGRSYSLIFNNAGQLVVGDDVRIAGQGVGKVRAIDLTKDHKAKITVELDDDAGRLHVGTRAVIRMTSLAGVANRYIALTSGPKVNPEIKDGSSIDQKSTTSIVDLDQLLNTFDPPTRRNLQLVVKGFATQYSGKERAKAAGRTIEYLDPMLARTRELVNQLTADDHALTAFLVTGSQATSALAERKAELSELVANANATTGAIASESKSLTRAVKSLPTTLSQANKTFAELRSTLDELDRLVAASKPATRELAAMLSELRPLLADARPAIADLRQLVGGTTANPGLAKATQNLPNLQKTAGPAFSNSTKALRRAQPMLEFARAYTPDVVGWIRDFGQAAAYYDANGHYARVQPVFGAFEYGKDAKGNPKLTARPPERRADGFQKKVNRRCPGASTQPSQDGSAPFKEGKLDCDSSQVPAGS